MSKASDDLPEPESPVTTMSLSRGISTSMFFRLFTRAPFIIMAFLLVIAYGLRKVFPVKGVKINRRKIRKNPWTAVGQRGERMCFDVKKGRPSGAVAEACREEAARAGGCAPFSPLCLRSGRRCSPGRAKVCFPAGRGGLPRGRRCAPQGFLSGG